MTHPARLSDALHLGVQPEVGVGALQGTLAEEAHLLVEPRAEAADGAPAHAGEAELGHEAVDLARTDAVDVGLLDDGHERLLRAAARLEEAGEVAAGAQPRDGELDLAGARLPGALAVAVSVRRALWRSSRAGRRRSARATSASISSRTNQASVSRRTSAWSSPMSLRTSSSKHRLVSAIVVLLSSCPCNGSDDSAAHGGRSLPGLPPQDLHHIRDSTRRRPPASRAAATYRGIGKAARSAASVARTRASQRRRFAVCRATVRACFGRDDERRVSKRRQKGSFTLQPATEPSSRHRLWEPMRPSSRA